MRTDRQTDRRTDMTKLIVALRNIAKAPKNILRHDSGSSLILVSLFTEIEAYY